LLVITPAPFSATSLTPRVALATASSPPHDYAQPSPLGGGPTSASYVVPPRPKPGRKPATDEPASKRKAQNRESQRAFRARKAAKLNEMQAQVEDADKRHQREMVDMQQSYQVELAAKAAEIAHLLSTIAQKEESDKRLEAERNFWRDRSAQFEAENILLKRQLKERSLNGFYQPRISNSRQDSPTRESLGAFTPIPGTPQAYATPKVDLGCGDCKVNGECACMQEMAKLPNPNVFMAAVSLNTGPSQTASSPMKDVQATSGDATSMFADREIDFTAQFSTKRSRIDNRPSITFLTHSSEQDSKCGFCTDESNCLCKDESLRTLQDLPRTADDMPPLSREPNGVIPNGTETTLDNCSTTGPGTCSDCMVNPRQRAWCQRVAQLRSSSNSDYPTSGSSRNSSISSTLEPIEPRIDLASVPDINMSNRYSIGCRDAFKLFEGRVSMDQGSMDWISNLKPISPTMRKDPLPARKYSALELDTAGVIATLQQSMGPLQPRPADGPNVDLVKLAQERQRTSDSPLTPRAARESDSPGLPISSLVNGAGRGNSSLR
ncbi:hypothetical protein K469DRAFT_556460, partial [Zopfia rhizophila CBS 207.26]